MVVLAHCENGRVVDVLTRQLVAARRARHRVAAAQPADRARGGVRAPVPGRWPSWPARRRTSSTSPAASRSRRSLAARRRGADRARRGVLAPPAVRRRRPRAGRTALRYVMTPPLRTADDRAALLAGLRDGATRHATPPTTATCGSTATRCPSQDDFTKIPTGLPGIGARLPLGFALGGADDPLAVERLVRGRPATRRRAIFGLYPRKGVIARGQRRRHRRLGSVGADPAHARARWTTGSTGRRTTASRCRAGCAHVLARGEQVVVDGRWVGDGHAASTCPSPRARDRVTGYPAVQPPSTVTMLPVMNPTSSDKQERDGRGDLLGPAGAAGQVAALRARPLARGQLRRRRRPREHRRVDRAGADAVDADALGGVVDRHRPREADQRPPSTRSTRGWRGSRRARTARRR